MTSYKLRAVQAQVAAVKGRKQESESEIYTYPEAKSDNRVLCPLTFLSGSMMTQWGSDQNFNVYILEVAKVAIDIDIQRV